MKLKPFLVGLTAMISLALAMQQPVFAAKKVKDSSSSSSAHHHKKRNKVLCLSNDKKCKDSQYFKHNIQLQLSDALGFPVEKTQFWVTIDVVKNGPLVTLQIPLINFQTGQISMDDPFFPGPLPYISGGYLYTSDGFLPECVRPNDMVPPSIVAASNNGMSPVFSFTQDPATLPQPPAGYIVQVTTAGELQVQQAGAFGNIIEPGPQILLPCSITYLVEEKKKLCKNFTISAGTTNVSQFPGNTALRDSQVNDAFDGVIAYAWGDNSMIADQSERIMNCMVAVGKVGKNGKVSMNPPVQLTSITTPNISSEFDHAVAINRANKDNIVVSYAIFDRTGATCAGTSGTFYRAVSFDRGKTWPAEFNGPLQLGSPWQKGACALDVADLPGVQSDKFGGIWYCGNIRYDGSGVLPNPGNFVGIPFFALSTDGGVTFEVVFTGPNPPADSDFDYPEYCFGGDEFGNYGLWFSSDSTNQITGDVVNLIGFIPITGLGQIGSPTTELLTGFRNAAEFADITASLDGRVWLASVPNSFETSSYIHANTIFFKSPGALDENWSGAWNNFSSNDFPDQWFASNVKSYPQAGYFFNAPRAIIYDETRKALYSINEGQFPDYSQNMRITLLISRDNGQTWVHALDISSTNFANRGYASMALDEKTGNLAFGWYDGRNTDPKSATAFQPLEYMGAVLPAKTLDKLVNAIPLSNPLFIVSSAATPPLATAGVDIVPVLAKHKAQLQKRADRYFEPKLPRKATKLKRAKT